MPIWRIEYYPKKGESDSPYDYILGLTDAADQAQIVHRLKFMSENQIGDWPNTWIHKLEGDIYQLTAGDHRLMYMLSDKAIVVLHACRKVKQKTHRRDKKRAIIHYQEFIERKG